MALYDIFHKNQIPFEFGFDIGSSTNATIECPPICPNEAGQSIGFLWKILCWMGHGCLCRRSRTRAHITYWDARPNSNRSFSHFIGKRHRPIHRWRPRRSTYLSKALKRSPPSSDQGWCCSSTDPSQVGMSTLYRTLTYEYLFAGSPPQRRSIGRVRHPWLL